MTKSLLYLMTAVMAGFFGLSITACGRRLFGNNEYTGRQYE